MPSAGACPSVSIALCTYNGAAFLCQQLDSLLAQTCLPMELVAFDDASTDSTWELLQTYAPRFAHAKLHRNEQTLGVRANFERALKTCRGEWIAPCDQDDLWRPDKLARLLQAADERTTLVYSDSLLIDENGSPLSRRSLMSERYCMVSGSDPRMFALSNCVSGHSALVRRRIVERALPIPEGAYYDWWLAFVAANLGHVVYVAEPLVQFRQHERNASGAAGQLKRNPRKSLSERLDDEFRNIESLASFNGPQQAFFQQLLGLWRHRQQRRLTPALALFLYRHRESVFAMKRSASWMKGRHALRFLAGGGQRAP